MSEASQTHAHPVRVGPYITVFAALMVLTIVTVGVSYIDLPVLPTVLVALAIASVKAGLVATFFMHLKSERAMVYWPLALTMFLFVGLLVSLIWSEGDHLFGTRFTDAFDSPAAATPSPEAR
jgi:cytochrome c oxidase subunit IV